MEGEVPVVIRVVLGGRPTTPGGERELSRIGFRERKTCKPRERADRREEVGRELMREELLHCRRRGWWLADEEKELHRRGERMRCNRERRTSVLLKMMSCNCVCYFCDIFSVLLAFSCKNSSATFPL